ncbi:hypothetical protein HanIR_Chr17g0875461 [Helianthus annuus]|nr:hypothetical protein HanIR_Chr17g0875461 [Helianthus annuus]
MMHYFEFFYALFLFFPCFETVLARFLNFVLIHQTTLSSSSLVSLSSLIHHHQHHIRHQSPPQHHLHLYNRLHISLSLSLQQPHNSQLQLHHHDYPCISFYPIRFCVNQLKFGSRVREMGRICDGAVAYRSKTRREMARSYDGAGVAGCAVVVQI